MAGLLKRTGVGEPTLGRKVVGHAKLARQIGLGRSPRLKRADKLPAFMEDYDPAHSGDHG